MPVRRFPLGDEPVEDLARSTTGAERVEMVVALSNRMLELTGQPAPEYSRAEMPVRISRIE